MKYQKKSKINIAGDKKGLTKAITFVIAVIVILVTIHFVDKKEVRNGEKNIHYYKAKVVDVLVDSTQADPATEGQRRGSQVLSIEFTNGPYQGEVKTIDNYISALFNMYAKKGTRLMIRTTISNEGPRFSVYNYDRSYIIYGFVALFILLLGIVGGKKGITAILSLGLTLIVLVKILLPLLLQGFPTLPTVITIIIISTMVNFILIDGINVKTSSAALGTIIGVALSGGLAYAVGFIGHISGFQMQEAETLLMIARDDGLKIANLFVAGILISSMGAVMDIAMSIASSIHELYEVNPKLKTQALFKSGMNIGRDAMGTMANTLILAYTGSSFNLLLLIYSYGIPYAQLINSDLIAMEIIRGVAGTIGVILTVPIVAYISSRIEVFKGLKQQ